MGNKLKVKNRDMHTYYIRSAGLQIREEDGKRTITGLIPYNSKSEDLGMGYIEEIASTAFNKTLSDKNKVVALYAHNPEKVLGNTANGTLQLDSQTDGLHIACTLPDTSYASDAYELIKSGTCDTMSFGFVPVKTEQSNGVTIIREAKLIEVSFCVVFPAYSETKSQARSIKIGENKEMDITDLENILNKDEPLTDDEVSQLQELLQAVQSKLGDNSNDDKNKDNATADDKNQEQGNNQQGTTTDTNSTTQDDKAEKEKERALQFEFEVAEVLALA